MAKTYSTPGVYVEEKSAFPNSVVPVPTSVAAFVGYTEKALKGDKDLTNVPTKISSFGEYLLYFGGGPKTTFSLTNQALEYQLTPKDSRFMLYNSIRFFFANGGADCYIVSTGNYDSSPTLEDFVGQQSSVGLATLLQESEPTIIVIPDAVLLGETDCQSLQRQMLHHCGREMHSRISILDIYDGWKERVGDSEDVIDKFRKGIGHNFLDFGCAYYPWMQTLVVGWEEIDLFNIADESVDGFVALLKLANAEAVKDGTMDQLRADTLDAEIDRVPDIRLKPDEAKALHQTLLAISPLYKEMMVDIRKQLNLLPPSGAMAGIFTSVDDSIGVWQAPANVSVGSVISPAVNINSQEQDDLNVPLSGKAINAIRTFPGKGVLVWGARTLDGNSQDWRYISVRRTVIYIEQSIKRATEAYVFEPNNAETWNKVKTMANSFLNDLWQQGALAGGKPEDAFSVEVGLGTIMTPVDILDGYLRVSVKIAVARPAEFIVITFEQKMQQA